MVIARSPFQLALALLLSVMSWPLLADTPPSFSATVIQQSPSGDTSQSRVFLAEARMRSEMQVPIPTEAEQGGSYGGGQPTRAMVNIVQADQDRSLFLDPRQQVYTVQPLPPGGAQLRYGAQRARNPCENWPELRCQRIGMDRVNGREAIHWRMTAQTQQGSMTMHQWIGRSEGLPLRMRLPNGASSEMQLEGREVISGREVQRWRTVQEQGGQRQVTRQWYDPVLKVMVREEFPGGGSRMLTDIKVGALDDALFEAPTDYRRVQPQADPRTQPSYPGPGR